MQKIDSFTLFISSVESRKVIEHILSIYKEVEKRNIYIVNFSSIKSEILFHEIKSNIVLVEMPLNNKDYLDNLIKKMNNEDFLVIVGAEKLTKYTKRIPNIKNDSFNLKNNLYLLNNGNWGEFVDDIDDVFRVAIDKISSCFVLLVVDNETRDKVIELSTNKQHYSIIGMESGTSNSHYEIVQKKIIESIPNLSLNKSIELINDNKNVLDAETVDYLYAIAYISNGEINSAINIYENKGDRLSNSNKLILANLYIKTSDINKAEELLDFLIQNDMYINGLIPILFSFISKFKRYDKNDWIKIIERIDPKNERLTEYYGNFYTRNEEYEKAAKKFRELVNVSKHSTYYELLARINEILANSYNENKAIAYIEEFLIESPEHKNEAYNILMRYLIEFKNSPYTAYSISNKIDFTNVDLDTIQIIKRKLDILKDIKTASRALGKIKPHIKKEDSLYLMKERTRVLIESIPVLSHESNGYLFWREYIDAQNNDVWIRSLQKSVLELLQEDSYSFESLPDNSYINEIEKSDVNSIDIRFDHLDREDVALNRNLEITSIQSLRGIRNQEIDYREIFNSIDELIEVVLTQGEMISSKEHSIWSKYYLSIIVSMLGEHQKANEIALTMFEYKKIIGKEYESLSILLGLIAWGNSQLRIGNEVEGIACLVASYKFNRQNKMDIYEPFLEEAPAMLTRFFNNNNEALKNKNELAIISDFCEKIAPYGESLMELVTINSEKSSDRINELENHINKYKSDSNVRVIISLFNFYLVNNEGKKALNLIENYFGKIYFGLENRLDVRAEILCSIADAYFRINPNIDNFIKALHFYELSLKDLNKRKNVTQKKERSTISEKLTETVRSYLEICALVYSAADVGQSLKQELYMKILNAVPLLTADSIIEQKNYNINKNLTIEMVNLEKKFNVLKEEFTNLYANNAPDSEVIILKSKEIADVQMTLKKHHPYHQALPIVSNTSIADMRKVLKIDEIFVQIIVTNFSIIILIISNKEIKIRVKLCTDSEKIFEQFSQEVQKNHSIKIKELNKIISQLIGDDIIKELREHNFKSLYVSLDHKMGLYPINSIESNGEFLIDKIESITNILDLSILSKKRETEFNLEGQIFNRVLGNNQEKNLMKINNWLLDTNFNNFNHLENSSDEILTISNSIKNLDTSLLILYGHGISDPNSSLSTGAIGIEGKNKLINLEELLSSIKNVDNLVLISCRGGMLNNVNPEKSLGVWTTILENFEGNIICCKWDVPTDSSIFTLNELLKILQQDNMKISKALLCAQKQTIKNYPNISEWAGLQFWIN